MDWHTIIVVGFAMISTGVVVAIIAAKDINRLQEQIRSLEADVECLIETRKRNKR